MIGLRFMAYILLFYATAQNCFMTFIAQSFRSLESLGLGCCQVGAK